MAALDLCTEMTKMAETQRIEEGLEKRICSAFVDHLNDSSLDVQTNAVKSIQTVAPIIRESNLIMIAETLAKMVIDASKKEVRDIYSLAIQSTINELKDSSAHNMIKAVYSKLQQGLNSGKPEVQEECLEILAQIFKKFGGLLHKNNNLVNKEDMMNILHKLLQSPHQGVRKRTSTCMGQFSFILGSRQLETCISQLMGRVTQNKGDKQDLLTLI